MNYQVFSENEWIYPDSPITGSGKALIERVCRSFDDYEFSAEALDSTRRELLEALG